VPPLSMEELSVHTGKLLGQLGYNPIYRDYLSLLVNNEAWREQLAAVPFERRLLLLPKCLRVESKCPALFDELGLVCENCGLCPIEDLTQEAHALGYAVLVAEGSAVVMNLIQTGKIEAVIGVSCMNVLRKAFPHMEAAGAPGIAIPLLQDDCADTSVDLDWVMDYIHLAADQNTRRLDLDRLRDEAGALFHAQSLELILGHAQGQAEQIAREWLARDGKRWRPFLTLATHRALTQADAAIPEGLKKVATAIECFHKASLIHDDIEDNDVIRYGQKTLHEEYGVPTALNAGDLLIGEGYRLLAESGASHSIASRMLHAASQSQRELCRGQGAELLWARRPEPLATEQVLDIFRQKTAPAFEVALRLGAIFADTEDECDSALSSYSAALGIAYQIRDDIADFNNGNDIDGCRPSLVLSLAWQAAAGEERRFLEQVWRREIRPEFQAIAALCKKLGAERQCEQLLADYKTQAIRSLGALENQGLKGLLRRIVGRIFDEIEFDGWCAERQLERSRTPAPPTP